MADLTRTESVEVVPISKPDHDEQFLALSDRIFASSGLTGLAIARSS